MGSGIFPYGPENNRCNSEEVISVPFSADDSATNSYPQEKNHQIDSILRPCFLLERRRHDALRARRPDSPNISKHARSVRVSSSLLTPNKSSRKPSRQLCGMGRLDLTRRTFKVHSLRALPSGHVAGLTVCATPLSSYRVQSLFGFPSQRVSQLEASRMNGSKPGNRLNQSVE